METIKRVLKTSSELYRDIIVPEMRPSIQAAMLAFVVSSLSHKNKIFREILKTQIKYFLSYAPPLGGVYAPQKLGPDVGEILFNFSGHSPHDIGIKKVLARQITYLGLNPAIIQRSPCQHFSEFKKRFLLFRGFNISSKKRREISEQCDYLLCQLESLKELNLTDRKSARINIIYWSTQIEREALGMEKILEINKVKLAVLMCARQQHETALQIACAETGTPSMLVPHGWPPKFIYPITSSFVKSFCYHHDQYLKTLCLKPNQVLGMGWLEPSVTLGSNLINLRKEKESTNKTEKQHILFFSQMHGKNVHRCTSLVAYIPHILKALDKMDAVETITLRLHPVEGKNPDNEEFLSQCNCSKLRLSVGKPIAEDLQASTMLMAFSSTALLYAPYLNMKGVEIRDEAINAEWGGTVLPPEQVYQIKGEFNPDEFCDFVANVPTLKGEDVFYNYGRELEAFGDFLETLI